MNEALLLLNVCLLFVCLGCIRSLKRYGVSCIPCVKKFILLPSADEFILIACDGFWGVWAASEAIEKTAELIQKVRQASAAAAAVAAVAVAVAAADGGGGAAAVAAAAAAVDPAAVAAGADDDDAYLLLLLLLLHLLPAAAPAAPAAGEEVFEGQ